MERYSVEGYENDWTNFLQTPRLKVRITFVTKINQPHAPRDEMPPQVILLTH
ncbi:hypothetical protein NPIL_686811, partial [Nephila pilipes]